MSPSPSRDASEFKGDDLDFPNEKACHSSNCHFNRFK